jgi:nickel-responsive transcriptional regulator NikR
MLSDSQNPTTALAALQNRPAASGGAAFVLPPGVPTMPPVAGDRLPVMPMPAQGQIGASPVVTNPRDPLTTMAKDRSAPRGAAADEGHAGAFNLQVASFRTDPEARSFETVLRQRGHHAFVETAQIPGRGTWYRVRIGPFKYMQEANRYRADFEAREHIVPFVVEAEKEKRLTETREVERRQREAKRHHLALPKGARAALDSAPMSDLVRFGVAMERTLLERFDERIARRGYENRSEALRDLVRADLLRDAWDRGGEGVATITLVYDASVRDMSDRLRSIEREAGDRVISSLHVNLGRDRCLEVIVARGSASRLRALADRLLGLRGVLTGELVAAAGEPMGPTTP